MASNAIREIDERSKLIYLFELHSTRLKYDAQNRPMIWLLPPDSQTSVAKMFTKYSLLALMSGKRR